MDSDDLYDVIMDGWEKKETEEGIPYYVHHELEKTSWDHPYLMKIFEELDDYSEMRYAAYRTAIKLRHLQKRLGLHMVRLAVLRTVLEDHGYNHGSLLNVDSQRLIIMLKDIYQTSDHRHFDTAKMEMFVDVILNFLLSLYDTTRRGFMKISSVKTVLVTLCSARLSDKYRFFYNEIRDPSTFVAEDNLAPFIHDLIQIPDILRESSAFGKNVNAVVNSCFKSTSSNTGISEDMFYRWLLMEPQTLIWLPTLHRVAATETVKHEAKCNICKSYPVVGFRYRCLKCFNFDMCQTCFFTGQTRGRHKLKHPIQEYCLASALKDDTKAFFKTVRNNMSKKYRRKSQIKYLPIDGSQDMGLRQWEQRSVPDVSRLSRDISQQSLLSTSTFKGCNNSSSQPIILRLNKADFGIPPSNTQSIKQAAPASDNDSLLLQKQRQELEAVIKQLDEENRKLYIQLGELKRAEDKQKQQSSDTESNISLDFNLQQENNLMKAKKEVVDDHNTRLRHQLDRVQKVLKENSPSHQCNDYVVRNTCTTVNTSVVYHKNLEVTGGPQATSSRNSSKQTTPSPNSIRTDPIPKPPRRNLVTPRRKDNEPLQPVTPLTPISPGWSQNNKSSSQVDEENDPEINELLQRIDEVFPKNMSYSAYSSGSKSYHNHAEMLEAANGVGDAMNDFVHNTVDDYYSD